MRLESPALRYFLAVAEERSISRAAANLRISQPALSKALRQLEDSLGVQLFMRSPSGATPTAYALHLREHALLVQKNLDDATDSIALMRHGKIGTLHIGGGSSLVSNVIPRAVAALSGRYPDLNVQITTDTTDELFSALGDGKFDAIVVALSNYDGRERFDTIELFSGELGVTCGMHHPVARMRKVGLRKLLEYPWVMIGANRLIMENLHRIFTAEGLSPPSPKIFCNSFRYVTEHLRASDALSVLARQQIESESSDLCFVDSPVRWRRGVGIVTRKNTLPSRALTEFIAILRGLGREYAAESSWKRKR